MAWRLEGMPRIRCAVCKRVADRVRAQRDDYLGGWRFTVQCHGAVDDCLLTDEFLQHADGVLDVGEAFTTPQISSPEEERTNARPR